MRELRVEHAGDIPADFLQKFWIEPGNDFVAFLSRLKTQDLSFLVEVADDGSGGPTVLDLIGDEVRAIQRRTGFTVPSSTATAGGPAASDWEFLSCKGLKKKGKDLRKSNLDSERREMIVIAASAKMLAPVDHKVNTIAKEFGFKNPLRERDDEPEKFVIIGGCVQWLLLSLLRGHLGRCSVSGILEGRCPPHLQPRLGRESHQHTLATRLLCLPAPPQPQDLWGEYHGHVLQTPHPMWYWRKWAYVPLRCGSFRS